MNAVILGAGGQLGEELTRQLPDAKAFTRRDFDMTDAAALRTALTAAAPDVVYNASSFNRVDAAVSDPGPAFAVNTLAIRELAIVCRDLGCRMVHFSTNYVFGRDLERRRPYREDDPVGPLNAYGVSKLMGEEFALMAYPQALIVRTAALFGRSATSRNNFIENMLAKARAGEMVRIVDDQVIAPTLTADLATAARRLVEAGAEGVFHFNGEEEATWYELGRAYLTMAGFGDRVRPATTAEIGAAARRPGYSVMGIDKYLSLGLPRPTPWRVALERYWAGLG